MVIPPSTPTWEVIACHEQETEALGAALGHALASGGVVALVGQLGAGKTRLVCSIAETLGADRRTVNSPTFVLIQEYEAPIPIYHCDTYRLRNINEFLDLGIDEIFESRGVVLVEWADRVASVLPSDHLRVEIEITSPTSRRFQIAATGPRSEQILAAARASIALAFQQGDCKG